MSSDREPELPIAPRRSLLDRLEAVTLPDMPEGGQGGAISAADMRAILASPALSAFLARRVDNLVKRGHGPTSDLELPLFKLPRKALEYLIASLDFIGHGDDAYINPERLELALGKLEIAGALLLAAHDRLCAARKDGLGGGDAETPGRTNGSAIC